MDEKLKPCPFCGSVTAPTLMDKKDASWDYCDDEHEILCPEFVVCCAVRKGGCGTSTGFVQEDEKEYAVELWNRRADSGMRKTNVFYEQFREKAEFIKQEIESLEKEIKYAPAEILPELKERIKLLRIMRHQYLEYADKYQKEYKNG